MFTQKLKKKKNDWIAVDPVNPNIQCVARSVRDPQISKSWQIDKWVYFRNTCESSSPLDLGHWLERMSQIMRYFSCWKRSVNKMILLHDPSAFGPRSWPLETILAICYHLWQNCTRHNISSSSPKRGGSILCPVRLGSYVRGPRVG